MKTCAIVLGLCLGLVATCAQAQILIIERPVTIVRPVPRPTPPPSEYKVKQVDVQASVKDQAAKVQLSQVFQNTGSTTLEAQLIFPVPENAALSGLTLLVDGKELTGKLMKKEDARRIYEEIVRRQRDPALLEYLGQGLYQTSVFPIPPQAERTVEIRYSQLLTKDNGLVDLLLPIGTSKHSTKAVETLNVTVRIEASAPLKNVYSPTHSLEVQRQDDTHAVCKLSLKNVLAPDDLRILYGTTAGLVGANVITYKPSDTDEGYFLFLASPELKPDPAFRVDKTLLFVFDRSGSMSGKKLEQAKEALKFLIQQLKPGDLFNIIAYDSTVESFKPELQRGDEAGVKAALSFADGLYAGGSTNIDGALQTALKQLTDGSRPTYMLFMTDGLPTVGELSELQIAAHVKQNNRVQARMFSFGVGYDVNSRLLDRLSREQRGQSVYVRPSENIETHVSALYNKIGSPLLTDISVGFEFDEAPQPGQASNISRAYPRQLTDLFQGEQLVYVGRYRKGGAAKATLTGTLGGAKKSFSFPVTFSERSSDETHGYVEKLWATRRIGEIIDELDLHSQNKELIDELVQLSIKHGIITPYTAFLAEENPALANREEGLRRASEVAQSELSKSSGAGGFSQREYKGRLLAADRAAAGAPAAPLAESRSDGVTARSMAPYPARLSGGAANGPAPAAEPAKKPKGVFYQDALGEVAEAEHVRTVGQKAFYRGPEAWKDSAVTAEQARSAIRIRQFSPEFFELAESHHGTFAKYLVFDEPVLVNLGDKTYLIVPDEAP